MLRYDSERMNLRLKSIASRQSMIRKSGDRFSEKIMLKQRALASHARPGFAAAERADAAFDP